MQLSLLGFTSLVRGMAAAVQSSARQFIDLTTGSALLAVIEASATVGLWLQARILEVLALTRAKTSSGADLDSWMAQFGVTRLPAVAATGTVTFSRSSTASAATIPIGTQVKSADGTQIFTTTAVGTIAITVASADVPVQAATAGVGGNVLANTITLLASSVNYVDTVNNAAAFTNGVDAESDVALRTRFQSYLASLARGTPVAIAYAVSSVQQGLSYAIAENQVANGTYTPGTFVVSFDDGSGAPSDALLTLVAAAVDAYRPITSTAVVQKATKVTATIGLTITCASSGLKSAASGPVATAIAAFVNALPVGGRMPYSRIAQLAYAASPNVLNVTAVLLNGGTADLAPTSSQVVRAGVVTVS